MGMQTSSGIAGIFNLDAPVDADARHALIAATGAETSASCRTEGRVVFACGAHGVLRVDLQGRMLIADARIDNAAELARSIGATRGPTLLSEERPARDADLVLAAYARWGEQCVQHLIGDFAFALWDPAKQSLFCARDPMGVRPFYYAQSDGRFCFAADPGTLLRLPGVKADIDQERVAHFLLNTNAGRERTFYENIRRLPAGQWLLRTPAAVSLQRYWNLDEGREIALRDDAEYAEAFHDLFAEAVRSRLADAGAVASTLSGGLDSSSIVCVARTLLDAGTPLHTVSLVFPDLPSGELRMIDERKYIASVTRDGGMVAHSVRGDRISPLGDVHGIVDVLHEPFAAPNLYLHWAMYGAAAAAGCDVILDGFDGDAVVSHGLARLDDLLAAGNWSSYECEVRAFADRRQISPARVADSFGVPRLDSLAAAGRWREWTRLALALHRSFGISRRDLLIEHGVRPGRGKKKSTDQPTLARRAIRASSDNDQQVAATSPVSARAAHIGGLMQPAYQDTLEVAHHCSRAFGMDARFPFFDRRLIEFCVALPAEQKFGNGWTRRVMRNAMQGVLPEEIRLRADKANLQPAFDRGLRNGDASLLRGLDVEKLDAFVDVDLLTQARDDCLDAAGQAVAGDDSTLLLRCATLAVWMEKREHDDRGVACADRVAQFTPALVP